MEDALARRTRALFLNAGAALEMAPVVADLMAAELGWNQATVSKMLDEFRNRARADIQAHFIGGYAADCFNPSIDCRVCCDNMVNRQYERYMALRRDGEQFTGKFNLVFFDA